MIKLLHVISQAILPNVLLLRDIPTPRILLFIFLFCKLKWSNELFLSICSLLNSTVSMNEVMVGVG